MDIALRARLPLVTTLVAAAVLAVVTGASNQSRGRGDGAGQELAVGVLGPSRSVAVETRAAPTTSTTPRTTTTSSVPGTTAAPTGQITAAVGPGPVGPATGAGPAAPVPSDEGGDDDEAVAPAPEPAPVRASPAVVPQPSPQPEPPPPPPPPPPDPVPSGGLVRLPNVELEVLTLTNADRGNNSVPPVYRDDCMDGEASYWARSMAESGVMAHSAGAGAAVQGCRGSDAYWGDNIGHWQPCYASEMEEWWMASPSHRPHILDANYQVVGIGVWQEPSGRCWFEVYFGS